MIHGVNSCFERHARKSSTLKDASGLCEGMNELLTLGLPDRALDATGPSLPQSGPYRAPCMSPTIWHREKPASFPRITIRVQKLPLSSLLTPQTFSLFSGLRDNNRDFANTSQTFGPHCGSCHRGEVATTATPAHTAESTKPTLHKRRPGGTHTHAGLLMSFRVVGGCFSSFFFFFFHLGQNQVTLLFFWLTK